MQKSITNQSQGTATETNAPKMSRKTFLKLSVGVAAITTFGAVTGCAQSGRRLKFSSINDILKELALIEANLSTVEMQQEWSLYKVLNHVAQSMEYSMTGYPQVDPPAQQAVAKIAFEGFKTQGYMTHDLAAPVPGAPEIPDSGPIDLAFERLRNACSDFQNFTGTLHPHFSYGDLSYEDWELAHAFHVANHFSNLSY